MSHAVCPGSFDPATLGHLDIIRRTSVLFDQVTVAVLINPAKQGLFTVAERQAMLVEAAADLPNITIDAFEGLLVDYCTAHGISAIVKGIRAVSDFDYELQMAQMNKGLTGVDTLFMPTNPEFSFLSSSLVKQVASYDGDVERYLTPAVAAALKARLTQTDR